MTVTSFEGINPQIIHKQEAGIPLTHNEQMLLAAAQAGISTTLEAEMVRAGAVSIPVNLLTKETLAEI